MIMPEPPDGYNSEYEVGDIVTFTNDYDVSFGPHKVRGFTKIENVLHGRFIYIDTDSPWFPVDPNQLSMFDDDNTPDCFELDSWIMENHRVAFDCTKYLNPSSQYYARLKIWALEGKPYIRQE